MYKESEKIKLSKKEKSVIEIKKLLNISEDKENEGEIEITENKNSKICLRKK